MLALVALGCSDAEIAERLQLAVETVRTSVRTASRTIGATRRPQLVLWVTGPGAV